MAIGYRKAVKYASTDITRYEATEGETIEERVMKISDLKEPIKDGAPYIETEAQEGVIPMYDIRTDPFDMALDEVTQIHQNSANKYAEEMARLNQKLQGGTGDTGQEGGDA